MKKKKNNKFKGLLAKYKEQETKGNLKGTGIKTLVDVLVGTTVGAGIGAGVGRVSLPVGLALIAGSHYFDEDTGVLRLAGSATIAYGIAKSIINKNIAEANAVNGYSLAGEASKAKARLTVFKDELLTTLLLDKFIKKEEGEQIGEVSTSSLDVFNQNNEAEALRYQARVNTLPQPTVNFEEEALAFDLVEEPDLTNI